MNSRRRATATLLGAAIVAGAITVPAWSDPPAADYFNAEDFSSEALFATGLVGIGARAMGMGGAYAAVSDDITALVYNPAGLAQLGRIEVDFGLQHLDDQSTHSMFGTEASASATHTGLDHVAGAYPFPTFRGSLVVAGGAFRARSNDLASSRRDTRPGIDDEFLRTQKDGVYRYTAGFGVDLVQSLSFGASVSYWEGQLRDDQFRTIDEVAFPTFNGIDRLVTDSDVDGGSFDLGLLGYVGRSGRLGLALHSPVWLDIRGDGELIHQDPGGGTPTSELLFIDQQPRLPWSMDLGASWALGGLLLSADARYTAWDEIDLDLPAGAPTDPPPVGQSDYEANWSGKAGAELLVPHTPLRVRAGYAFEPEPYALLLGNSSRMVQDKQTWTLGGGLLLADAFALDVAVAYSHFQRDDQDFSGVFETRDAHRVYLTGAYRY